MTARARGPCRALLLLALGACAGAPPGGDTIPGEDAAVRGSEAARDAAPRAPSALRNADVAVLPLGALVLPDGVAWPINRDSLTVVLARHAASAFPSALDRSGAVGAALGPAQVAASLAVLGPETMQAAFAAVARLRAAPLPVPLDAAGRDAFGAFSQTAGVRYVFVPVTLRLTMPGVLRFEGEVDAAVVDAPAGRVVWRASIRTADPLPPSGAVEDVLESALRRTIEATAQAAAAGLLHATRP